MKVSFNLCNFAFIAVVALAVFHAIAAGAAPPGRRAMGRGIHGDDRRGRHRRPPIASAISLSGGAPQFQKLPEMLKFGGMVALANTSLALLAVSVM